MTIDQYKNDELIHENHKSTNNEAIPQLITLTDNPASSLVEDNSLENSKKNIFKNDVVDLQDPAEIVITQKLFDQKQEQSSSFVKNSLMPELTGQFVGFMYNEIGSVCYGELRKFNLCEHNL